MNKNKLRNRAIQIALVLGLLSVISSTSQAQDRGVLNGVFSVSETVQVKFSIGNLQYQASTNTWRFAENQWDYVGADNANISETYNGWIDLFGWGTSGFDHGAVYYQPWSTSTNYSHYYAYGNSNYNLFNQTGLADWGSNTISSGGNTIYRGWRTLTADEWDYLFYTRSTVTGKRFAMANVNNVNGIILFPDYWNSNYDNDYSFSNVNYVNASYNSNVITASDWNTMEQRGAVFLPAAGARNGESVANMNSYGYYWSSSHMYNDCAFCVPFKDNAFNEGGYSLHYFKRYLGFSVRLVRSAKTDFNITVTSGPTEGGVVTGGGVYPLGNVCAVTAVANNGYVFVNWTEDGEEVSVTATYSFTANGNRTLVANFADASGTGVLNGVFSVGGNSHVCFSKGNLQYQASTNTWRFANHQWDYVGETNSQASEFYSGWIDYFGWGTSGYHHGAVCYQPWSMNSSYNYFYAYGNETYNLYDQTGQADWGYNVIVNGGNTENHGWRTPTHEEWEYLFNIRSTLSGIRYVKANVNDVNGVILLPDNWSESYYSLNSANSSDASFTDNVITSSQWMILEQNGAVFLPAAGYRFPFTQTGIGSVGDYWSSSCGNGTYSVKQFAWDVIFSDTYITTSHYFSRNYGLSVRLVCNASVCINTVSNPAEGGTVSGGGLYQEGTVCSLTATANNAYVFVNWTENGEVVSSDATYSFTVIAGRNLVANFAYSGVAGLLNGTFSVGDNSQVNFSQGNLQYRASTNTWRFAENQWDFVGSQAPYYGEPCGTVLGSDNNYISSTYDGWIDLFGWGTSGYNHGAEQYQPWSVSPYYGGYYAYGNADNNLYDQTGQADWGYNAISNGGNTENIGWRTLTNEEWSYLINTRNTLMGIRFAMANVNDVNGVILLPDDWMDSYYSLNAPNSSDVSYNSNVITLSQWSDLEQHGAVFLPASGLRGGSLIQFIGSNGNYWSSSFCNNQDAYGVAFGESGFSTGGLMSYRYVGISVRLVCSSNRIIASPNPTEGGIVSGGGTYSEGATCTLTASANEGYAFVNWTENGEVISHKDTFEFVVSGNRTLVANFQQINLNGPVIELYPGWNWISNLLTYTTPLDVALSDLNPSHGDMIKSQNAFSTYNANTGCWEGSLTHLVPGRGLIYLNKSSQTKSFHYPQE